jgi:hypothetical protein
MQELRNSVLDHLIKRHLVDENFNFMLRERDGGKGDNRRGLFNGYWFIGEDHNYEYFQTSFWKDRDNTKRVYAIALTFTPIGKLYLEISWSKNKEYEKLALRLKEKKYDFFTTENRGHGIWFVFNESDSLEYFIDTIYDKVATNVDQLMEDLNISNPRVVFEECESMIKKVGEYRFYGNRRLARVCWNNRGWVMPSGHEGKSSTEGAYENQAGFGHEEWLANSMFDLDGYRYTHLQPFKELTEDKAGKIDSITLYSRNSVDGQWYWVGSIKEPTLISTEESRQITSTYHKKGWVKIMQEQVDSVGAKWVEMPHVGVSSLFNLKFESMNLVILDNPILVNNVDKDRFITINHYVPLINRFGFDPVSLNREIQFEKSVAFRKANTLYKGTEEPRPEGSYSKMVPTQDIHIERNHNEAQNLIYKYLVSQGMKESLFERQFVDVSCITPKGSLLLIEVKTHEQIRYAIRYALGQLLEYSGWNQESRNKNTLLAIATTVDLDEQSSDYLYSLRDRYRLEIGHLYVDLKAKKVTPRIKIW